MIGWRLTLRKGPAARVDASSIDLAEMLPRTSREIAALPLKVAGRDEPLGDWFQIEPLSGDASMGPTAARLEIHGDLSRFDGVGANHRLGRLCVHGSVGDHCASAMTAGFIEICGDVGHFLGGPMGSRSVGMRGGRVRVAGDVGNYAGHRMRRGELLIEGSTGDFLGSQQIAGTLVVGGRVGRHPAYGMRRGTLLVRNMPELSSDRFSYPVPMKTPFAKLLYRSILSDAGGESRMTSQHLSQVASDGCFVSRGDLAVAGLGEIWAIDSA